MDEIILRRINFLIDAAKNEIKQAQDISLVMRVISNYATIGKDAGSASVKKLNKRVSKKAKDILINQGLEKFTKLTINEHSKPISETWKWLRENATNLSAEDVWKEFCNHPMTTITKDEDRKIRSMGLKSSGGIQERYVDLDILVEILEEAPKELIKNMG